MEPSKQELAEVREKEERIWSCKIGGVIRLPRGADGPMRQAVAKAFIELTGEAPDFIFSGWGGELTEPERAVVEDRLPSGLANQMTPDRDMVAVLHSTTDGSVWAAEFVRVAKDLGYSDMDEGWLIGWFANAIMCGYDTHAHRHDATLAERDAKIAAIKKVRDGYADQAKFADHEPAAYFREFVRRIDEASLPASAAQMVAVMEAAPKMAEFVQWVLQEGAWQGSDLDGGSIQDTAEELGLIVKVPFDPEKHGDCNNAEGCGAGDDWYVLADWLEALTTKTERAGWDRLGTL